MREELLRLLDLTRDVYTDMSGNAALEKLRDGLRALAERAPAGGEPVAWVSKDDSMFAEGWSATNPILYSKAMLERLPCPGALVPLYAAAPPSQPVAPQFRLAVSPDLQARLDACAALMADWPDYMKRAAQAAPPSQPAAVPDGLALTKLRSNESACEECGRAVWNGKDRNNRAGWVAKCGRYGARIEDCGTMPCAAPEASRG